MSFTEGYKKGLVEDIVLEVGHTYDYKDFAADCVRKVVSEWDDKELADWFGREESTEKKCKILDNIDCYCGDCEHC